MSRIYDNLHFIQGSFVTDGSPLDDRFVVQTQADLFLDETWEDRGLYSGLFTAVINDSVPENNGLYVLKSISYRNKQSWDQSSLNYSPNGWFRVGAIMDTFLSSVTVMEGSDISDYNTEHATSYDITKVYLKFVFTTKPDGITPVQQDIIVDVTDFYDNTDTQYIIDLQRSNKDFANVPHYQITANLQNKDTGVVESTDSFIIPKARETNGEPIEGTMSGGYYGDINLDDGYYFPNAAQDADGNWYGAVIIGNQVWLGENFRCKTFQNGIAIQHHQDNQDPEVPCYYDGPATDGGLKKHGLSYNYAAYSKTSTGSGGNTVNELSIENWHVPSNDDWEQMLEYIHRQKRHGGTWTGLAYDIFPLAAVEEWTYTDNGVEIFTRFKNNVNSTGFNAYPTIGYTYCRFASTTVETSTYSSYLCNLEDSSNKFFHKSNWAEKPQQMWVRLVCDMTPSEFRAWYVTTYGTMQHLLSDNELEVVFIEKVGNNYVCDKKDVDFLNMLKKGKQPIFYYKESDDSPYITQKGPLVCGENNYFCIFTNNDDEYLSLYFELHILCAENKIETFVLEYEDIPDNNEIQVYHLVKTTTYKEIDGEKIVDLDATSPIPFYTHDGEYYPNAMQDADGNWYGAVIVGNQVWLGENLKTTKFADGTPITNGGTGYSDSVAQYYEIVATNHFKNEGLRYNWTAIINGANSSNSKPSNVQGVAPTGCHIPSAAEWQELLDYVGDKTELYENTRLGTSVSKALSSQLATHGRHNYPANIPGDEPEKNNYTMFTAMPTGMGGAPSSDNQQPLSFYSGCYFASCTESSDIPSTYMRICFYDINSADDDFKIADGLKVKGWAVRCLVDKTPYQFRAWYCETYGSMQHHLPEDVQVQADWNQTTATAPDYIKNKPDLSSFITLNDVPQEVFVCNYNTANNTMDKTPQEILAAKTSGKLVMCKSGSYEYYCHTASSMLIIFSCIAVTAVYSNGNAITGIGETTAQHIVYADGAGWGVSTTRELQQQLVSGTNIKTINGTSILGSGDITTTELPAVTASDNGKILIVDNGAWAAQSVPVAAIVLLPSGSTSAQRTDAEQQIRALGYTHGILYDANGYIAYNGTSKKFEYNNSVVQWSKQLDSNDNFAAALILTSDHNYQFMVADSGLSGKIEWDFDKYTYLNNGTQAEPDYTLVPFDVHTADENCCAEMFSIMVDDPTNTPTPAKAVIEMMNEWDTSMWGYTLFVNRDAVIRDAHEVATIPATLSWDSNNNEYILECDYTPKEVAEIMRQEANRGIPVVMHVMCERRTDTSTDIDYPTGSRTYQWTQEYDVPLECINMHKYDSAQTNENYYTIHGVLPVMYKYLIGISDDDVEEKYLEISGTWESEDGLAYEWLADFFDRPWCERPNSLHISTSYPENGAVTVDFPKRTRRYHEVYANSNFTINITAENSAENYVRVFNTSNSEISVTIGTVSYYDTAIAAANIITVPGGISIAAGTSAEISAIVFSDQAIISCKGNVNPKELPAVTASDNGKILIVDNGAWAAQSVPVADSVLYPNSNN